MNIWSKSSEMVRALASHQCGLGLNPGVNDICGLSLLLVLSLAPRGFSLGTPVFPLLKELLSVITKITKLQKLQFHIFEQWDVEINTVNFLKLSLQNCISCIFNSTACDDLLCIIYFFIP